MPQENPKKNLPYRVKNELKFRELSVINKEKVAGCFWRITFHSDGLADFSSAGFDDHIKIFFPAENGECLLPEITDAGIVWPEGHRPLSRDYTPLAFDAERNTLTIDFFIHEGGVASDWATHAGPGDRLITGGPRGSLVIPTDYSWQLYLCDESSLPAVLRRLRSLPGHITPQVWVNASAGQPEAYLNEIPQADILCLDSATMAGKLKAMTIPPEDYFIWIAGEGRDVKQLSDLLLATHKLDSDYLRATAYWHKKET